MKREQNNGQREGKVLINSSTSFVLALGCVALHYPGNGVWWWRQHHWWQCFVYNSARIRRRELQIQQGTLTKQRLTGAGTVLVLDYHNNYKFSILCKAGVTRFLSDTQVSCSISFTFQSVVKTCCNWLFDTLNAVGGCSSFGLELDDLFSASMCTPPFFFFTEEGERDTHINWLPPAHVPTGVRDRTCNCVLFWNQTHDPMLLTAEQNRPRLVCAF